MHIVYALLKINTQEFTQLINKELARIPQVTGGQLAADRTLEEFLKQCQQEAHSLGDQYISLEHVMITMAQTTALPESIKHFLKQSQFTKQALLQEMQTMRKGKTVKEKNAENSIKFLKNIVKILLNKHAKANLTRSSAAMKKFDA